jgi:hypothetical protein
VRLLRGKTSNEEGAYRELLHTNGAEGDPQRGIERDMFFSPEFTSISTVRILRDRYGVHGLNDHAHLFSDEVTD